MQGTVPEEELRSCLLMMRFIQQSMAVRPVAAPAVRHLDLPHCVHSIGQHTEPLLLVPTSPTIPVSMHIGWAE